MKSTYFLDSMRAQEKWRIEECINLMPSENQTSPQARALLSADFVNRYTLTVNAEYAGEYMENSYRGTRITTEIERKAEELAREVYGCKYACVEPLSGHIAAMIAIVSTTSRGDKVLAISEEFGGYDGYAQKYIPDIVGLRAGKLPFEASKWNLDYEAAAAQIRRQKPKVVILGASLILFPYDMPPIKEACDGVGATLLYDGSHVMGLIAGGEFQKPLRQGADILYGSTHKTLPGPQGGIVLTDSKEMDKAIRGNLTWRLMDNAHWNRIASLGQTLLEMRRFGPAYARQVVRNSKRLGKELKERGVPIMFEELGFSESHQLLMDRRALKARYHLTVNDFANRMERSNLIIDAVGRIGTCELTRIGMKEKHLPELADLFAAAAGGKAVKKQVKALRNQFDMDFRYR
ncbi:MAG: PLP-dependent transferase [Candidatus Thermoplasmatota archaeon]|nr:PLP-dependent transferase [Candidatus Thermoplasmatota archaeon]